MDKYMGRKIEFTFNDGEYLFCCHMNEYFVATPCLSHCCNNSILDSNMLLNLLELDDDGIIKACKFIISDLAEIIAGNYFYADYEIDFSGPFHHEGQTSHPIYRDICYNPGLFLEIFGSSNEEICFYFCTFGTTKLSKDCIKALFNYLILPFDIKRIRANKSARF